MSIIAYVTDLLFSTKITSTAQALGVPVTVVRSSGALTSALELAGPASPAGFVPRVIVDLSAEGNPIAAIEAVKSRPAPAHVVAYVSHVQADLATAARAAGADEVMPRSAFSANLPTILRNAPAARSASGPEHPA